MTIQNFIFTVCLALIPMQAISHHSYADYERSERFTFTGTLINIEWSNPHIILTVENSDDTYRIEWVNNTRLQRGWKIPNNLFKTGEEITIIGSKNKREERKIITLVKEIRFPHDRWLWVSDSLAFKPTQD